MKYANLKKSMPSLPRLDADTLLERLGLERRRSTFERVATIVGIFGAGILVGAGAGLLASPVPPADVRKKLGEGVRTVKNEINNGMRHAKQEIVEGARHAKHQVDDFVSREVKHNSPRVGEHEGRNGAIKAT
ncbi:YtxH domain-containing protein [Pendulispora rubella]|uniref:YtxH domain-containing protein n=1 Tax=Pendulispora rubella TaxID=2741070 RepID=A0ABZ2LAQ4_9BACT